MKRRSTSYTIPCVKLLIYYISIYRAPLPPPILPTLPPSHIHSQLVMFSTPRPGYPILPAVRMPPTDIDQLVQLPSLRLPESSNQPHEIGPPQNPISKYTDVLRSQVYEKNLIDTLNEKPLPQIQKQTPKPTPTVKVILVNNHFFFFQL